MNNINKYLYKDREIKLIYLKYKYLFTLMLENADLVQNIDFTH